MAFQNVRSSIVEDASTWNLNTYVEGRSTRIFKGSSLMSLPQFFKCALLEWGFQVKASRPVCFSPR